MYKIHCSIKYFVNVVPIYIYIYIWAPHRPDIFSGCGRCGATASWSYTHPYVQTFGRIQTYIREFTLSHMHSAYTDIAHLAPGTIR